MKLEEALKKSDEYHAVEINKLREVIEILRAENARYREAFSEIMIAHASYEPASMIAREALKGE